MQTHPTRHFLKTSATNDKSKRLQIEGVHRSKEGKGNKLKGLCRSTFY